LKADIHFIQFDGGDKSASVKALPQKCAVHAKGCISQWLSRKTSLSMYGGFDVMTFNLTARSM